jgi:fructose-1,6-bisphosphatase/inositol monophosphatase family enzyme
VIDEDVAAQVEREIRTVARDRILPYFGRLGTADVREKAPGDLVTAADRGAEEALTEALTRILPGSVVVGEEAVGDDPTVLRRLAGDDPVWIIDPVDGTHNFTQDSPRFTTLVTLAEQGELVASWTFAPALGRMATARRGGGAFVDGERVRVRTVPAELSYLDVCTTMPRHWSAEQRAGINALSRDGISLAFFDTSGLEYVEIAAGRRSVMVMPWQHPWDHAAGVLLLAEAGGVTCGADGAPFKVAGGNALPLVAAPDPELAALVQATYASGTPRKN